MRRDQGCIHQAGVFLPLVWIGLMLLGAHLAAGLGWPTWACIAAGIVSPFIFAYGFLIPLAPIFLWLALSRRILIPRRIAKLVREIEELDLREAEDRAFECAFRRLEALARDTDVDRYVGRIERAVLYGDGPSRRRYLAFLEDRVRNPRVRPILRQIANSWSDPLLPEARRILDAHRIKDA